MKDTLGIIYLTSNSLNSWYHSMYELPVAAGYKLIDFALSSMVNSGIVNIAVLSKENYVSLYNHLRSGAQWNLDINDVGLRIIPYKGDYLKEACAFAKNSREKYVLLCRGDAVYNINYRDLYRFHTESKADITAAVTNCCTSNVNGFYEKIYKNGTNEVSETDFRFCNPTNKCISMGIYLMKRQLFLKAAEKAVLLGETDDIIKFITKRCLTLKVLAYDYQKPLLTPQSAAAYYELSKSFLSDNVINDILLSQNRIYTNTKSYPPTILRKTSDVKRSILGDGCIIEGTVYDSVLFGGVKILKGASITDSIIMDKCFIGRDCCVQNAIIKEECIIKEGVRIMGNSKTPSVVEKGTIVTSDMLY